MKRLQLIEKWDSFCSVGVRKFLVVWLGQLVSLAGTGITSFVIGLWVYQRTGSVTKFALISLVAALPVVVLSPVAGALVDRWDRRKCMLLGDAGAALCVLAMVVLLTYDRLRPWEVYLAVGVASSCAALHWPAYSASITLLVPKVQYGRANGMMQLGQAVSRAAAPFLGGFLLATLTIRGALMIDLATFVFALVSLSLIRFPLFQQVSDPRQRLLWTDVLEGWNFVRRHGGLFSLILLFAIANFFLGLVTVLVTPLLLAFTSTQVLGSVLSVAALGMLLAGLTMSAWGGPVNRIRWVIGSLIIGGLCVGLGGLRASIPLVAATAFGLTFCIMTANICTRTIIQTKVPPSLQGRVFAFLAMIAFSSLPLAYPLAGPLAERVFEPLMSVHGPLARSVGRVIGVGPGRGIALLFVVVGGLIVAVASTACFYPRLRELESELSDVDLVDKTEVVPVQPAVSTSG